MDERTRRSYPTDRNAASAKRTTDVKATKWPVITHLVYQDTLNASASKEGVNIPLARLCMARIRLGQSLLALDGALSAWSPKRPENAENAQAKAIWAALRGIRDGMEKFHTRFPLEIVNK